MIKKNKTIDIKFKNILGFQIDFYFIKIENNF